MVDHGPIILHLLCTPITFFTVFFLYLLHRRYRHPFLQPYLYYVVLDGLGSLADIFFRILPFQLDSSGQIRGAFSPFTSVILNLFALPIQALMIFFFITAVSRLLGLRLKRWPVVCLWIGYALVFILTLVGVMNFINFRSIVLLRQLMWLTVAISSIFMMGPLVYGLKYVIREKVKERRIFFWVFTASYLVSFSFQTLLIFTRMAGVWVTFLVLGTHLPVLVILPFFLSKNAAVSVRNGFATQDIDQFYKRKGVSGREQEIIAYLIQGFSNREIEEKLFISRRTVENHVYNIYRKLGVGNRVQLVKCIEAATSLPVDV